MKLPDITPAQLVALVGSVIAVLVAAGLDLSSELQTSIIALTGVLGALLLGADAVIRNGRSRALGLPPKPPIENDQAGL